MVMADQVIMASQIRIRMVWMMILFSRRLAFWFTLFWCGVFGIEYSVFFYKNPAGGQGFYGYGFRDLTFSQVL